MSQHYHSFQSLLINGRGQFNCSLAAKYGNTTLLPQCNFKGGEECAPKILHVEPNKTYRIRIASTTSLASLNLAISVCSLPNMTHYVAFLYIYYLFNGTFNFLFSLHREVNFPFKIQVFRLSLKKFRSWIGVFNYLS